MKNPDIRWLQRLANYKKALKQLTDAVELAGQRELSNLEKQGLIQAFEYTHELAWNTLKDFYEEQGESGLQGSKDTIRLAVKRGLIENGEVWMDMINNRNRTSHTYNEETANEITAAVTHNYQAEFMTLAGKLDKLEQG